MGQRQEGKLHLAGKLITFLMVIPTNATEAYIFRKNNYWAKGRLELMAEIKVI